MYIPECSTFYSLVKNICIFVPTHPFLSLVRSSVRALSGGQKYSQEQRAKLSKDKALAEQEVAGQCRNAVEKRLNLWVKKRFDILSPWNSGTQIHCIQLGIQEEIEQQE